MIQSTAVRRLVATDRQKSRWNDREKNHLFQEEDVRPVLVLPIPYEGGRKGGEDAGLLKSVPSQGSFSSTDT